MGFSLTGQEVLPVPKGFLGPEADEDREVSMAHFAAICGITQRQFMMRMYGEIMSGSVAKLLKESAQEDFLEWAAERFYDEEKEALLFIRLSLNRKRDVGLYCVLDLETPDVFPRIPVKYVIPGFGGCPPRKHGGLSGFEVSFCDMETSFDGGRRCQEMSRSKSTKC